MKISIMFTILLALTICGWTAEPHAANPERQAQRNLTASNHEKTLKNSKPQLNSGLAGMTKFQVIAFKRYLKDDMGVSKSATDYHITQKSSRNVVTIEISPKKFTLGQFGGKGKYGFDAKFYIGKNR